MVELSRAQTVEELIATVAFYGMAEIPADLLECLEEIAADLAKDGTWRVRWAFPYRSMRLAG
jgi:predicted alpha/beta-hydrolase family hydrolase